MRKSKIRKFDWLITNNHLQESQSNQKSPKKSYDSEKSNNTVSTNMMSNPKNEVFRTIYRK